MLPSSTHACLLVLAFAASTNAAMPSQMELTYLTDAHGVLMAVAFGFIMTIGSGLMRLPFAPYMTHTAVMLFGYICMLAGFGLGVYIAYYMAFLDQHHAIIGFIVVGMLFLQPAFGLVAHTQYAKSGRNVIGLLHRWNGRVFITLGVINGGLGLQLADANWRWKVAYSTVAGVLTLAWWGISLSHWFRHRKDDDKIYPHEKGPLDGPAGF